MLLVIVVGVLYHRYTDSARVRAHAEAYLQKFLSSPVSVKSASFSLFEGVRLHGVTIVDPFFEKISRSAGSSAARNSAGTVFYCEEIHIEHDPMAALGGKLLIRSLIAFEPVCTIVHDADSQKTNLGALFLRALDRSKLPDVIPTVELRDARVRVLSMRNGKMRTVESLRLTVRGRSVSRNAQLYDVSWQSGETSATSGISQVDLSTGLIRNLRGGLPSMSVEAVMLVVNAGYDGVSAWRDLLGLEGKVRARDYNLIGDETSQGGRSATIDLNNATVSIPSRKEEIEIPPDQRYLRFTDVNGTVHVTENGVRAEFTATFHGAKCSVSTTLTGGVEEWNSLDDVAFDAQVTVKSLTLPDASDDAPVGERIFVHGWRQLESFYDKFDPSGRVDLFIAARKSAGAGEPVTIKNAELVAKGASATYHRYPYRGENVFGKVEFASDGVWIRELCAKRDGGTVCVDGWLANTKRGAAARIRIDGKNVAIDDSLFAALGRRYQKIRDDFSPSGRIDLSVTTTREQGSVNDLKPWQTQTLVTLRDAAATYRHFPYAIDHVEGQLQIASGRVELVDVVGSSHGGTVTVNGSVAFDKSVADNLALRIVGDDIPLDEKLLDALPVDRRASIAALHVSGSVNVVTQLTRDPNGRAWPKSKVTWNDASIRPDFFPIPMTNVSGVVLLDPSSVTFEGVSARYGSGELSLTGSIVTAGDTNSIDVSVEAHGLSMDELFRSNAPKPLRRVLSQWRVTGPVDASAHLRTGDDGALAFDGMARLFEVSVEHDLFPIPFTNVQGDVRFANSAVSSTNLKAKYADAGVEVEFETQNVNQHETGRIKLRADHLSLSQPFRGLLSPEMRASWDKMDPRGSVDLRLEELTYDVNEQGEKRWQVKGEIAFEGVAIPGVLEMNDLKGTVSFLGAAIDERGGTLLSGTINLSRGEVLGKLTTNARASWQYARAKEGYGRIVFSPIDAAIYDGRLTGYAEVLFDQDEATYSVNTLVQSMRVAAFLAGTEVPSPSVGSGSGSRSNRVEGRANVQLHLSGTLGQTTTRRGGGSFEIVNGRIYHLPLVLAILNSLKLSAPDEGVFDEAQARFFVSGNTVSFDEIVLRGSVVALVGSGTMKLPEYTVDLDLVNIAPEAWGRLPLLTDVLEGAARELMGLRVTGPVSGPSVRVRPLPNITDEVKRLFQRRRSRRVVSP